MTARTDKTEDSASGSSMTDIFKSNPWIFIILAFMGGGGSGTLLSRPVFAEGMAREDVQAMIDASFLKNNEVLLQRIELMLAREKLRGAGLTTPTLGPPPE